MYVQENGRLKFWSFIVNEACFMGRSLTARLLGQLWPKDMGEKPGSMCMRAMTSDDLHQKIIFGTCLGFSDKNSTWISNSRIYKKKQWSLYRFAGRCRTVGRTWCNVNNILSLKIGESRSTVPRNVDISFGLSGNAKAFGGISLSVPWRMLTFSSVNGRFSLGKFFLSQWYTSGTTVRPRRNHWRATVSRFQPTAGVGGPNRLMKVRGYFT